MDRAWEQAARAGDAELLQALSASMDANARDAHGQTALMLAAHAGHPAAVRVLLERGADAHFLLLSDMPRGSSIWDPA